MSRAQATAGPPLQLTHLPALPGKFLTGREGRWELAFRFDMRDGLIQRYHLYEDSLSATLLHRAEGAWTLDREGERAAFPIPNKLYGGPVLPPSAQPETGATR